MNKFLTAVKRAPKRFIALAIALAAIVVPATLVAMDTTGRPEYTIAEINSGVLGDKIVLNSIKDNPIGHEFNFVNARVDDGNRGKQNVWHDEITVEKGKTYLVRMYVHNNNPKGEGAIARNVTSMFEVPTTTGKSINVTGALTSSNATPQKIWDGVTFKSNQDFNLAYVPGSALYENNLGKFSLKDTIVTSTGVRLGYKTMNGDIPGCFQYDGFVTFAVKPQFAPTPDLSVSKKVRIKDDADKTWKESVNAKAGQEVEFQIEYKNTGEIEAQDVTIRDFLPTEGLTFVRGTTTLYNTTNPNGYKMQYGNDVVTNTGVNIGNYAVGSNAYVRFTTKVAEAKDLACNTNTLRNIGRASDRYTAKEDSADVIVEKDCPKEPVYTCDNLGIKKINRTKFEFSNNYTAKDGATYVKTVYIVKDANGKTVQSSEKNIFESNTVGKYTVEARVTFKVNGSNKTVTSTACKGSLDVLPEDKPNCPIPGKEHLAPDDPECKEDVPVTPVTPPPAPTDKLPVTGPGEAFMTVAGIGTLTTAITYYIASRRQIA
ncbi:MAG: DUF11 domain-containing protein [Candidatus Nomurabacteria bacterium]|jgi:uncharacterized repeat protein (TIGR01451 family)|nr:DUF11 domain-containing protein [Candidatus Nomurabacteria bacterium]